MKPYNDKYFPKAKGQDFNNTEAPYSLNVSVRMFIPLGSGRMWDGKGLLSSHPTLWIVDAVLNGNPTRILAPKAPMIGRLDSE